MSKLLSVQIRAAICLAGCGLLVAAALPATISAATQLPITFNMQIYGQCLGGQSTLGTTIHVDWRNSSGALKATGSTATDSYSEWSYCPADTSVAVLPGDRVKVSDGSYTRSYVVPDLTIQADRVNELYKGTGPVGRTITLHIPSGDFERSYDLRAGKDGTWSFKPSGGLGGSYSSGYIGYVSWNSPNSDHLEAYTYFPQIGVTLGQPRFYGRTSAFADVTASISDGSHDTGSATGDASGSFSGTFRDSHGNAVAVSPGDIISAPSLASNADWIVPAITGSADKSTEMVTGICSDTGTAAGYVEVWVVRVDGHLRAVSTWGTAEDGSFVADFTDYGAFGGLRANIKTGDRIKIDCYQTTGDFARLTFVVK